MKHNEPDRTAEQQKTPTLNSKFRSDRKTLALGLYPGDIHPGLLSGVGIDDQQRDFSVDKTIIAVTASLIVAFVVWGIVDPESVGTVASAAFDWAM